MADFLNRLAARALGTISQAEPLLPARFSPRAEQIGRPAPGGTEASVESDAAPAAEARLHAQELGRPSHFDARYSEAAQPDFDDRDDPRAPRPTFARPAEEAHGPFATEIPVGQPPDYRRSRGMDPFPGVTPQQRPNPRQDVIGEIFSRDPHADLPVRPPFAEPVSTAHLGLVPGTRGTARREAQPNAGVHSAAPPVRVTIGRIDVRAEIASPLAAAVPRTRPSTLSLDQFLNRGAGTR
jgi:hypothetical protein